MPGNTGIYKPLIVKSPVVSDECEVSHMNLPGINYEGGIAKTISSDDTPEVIMMYKPRDYFEDITAYTKFVKSCERMVRHSDDYKAFLHWVKDVLGMNFCQVSSNIVEGDATIEMHHGPIFTLFDYCAVILNDAIQRGDKISTFRISNRVIEEHFALRVQVVMLAKTNHEAITNRDLFLNIRQGIGNVDAFIKKYMRALDDEQKYKIWSYINFSKSNETFDTGILDVPNLSKMLRHEDRPPEVGMFDRPDFD